MSEEYKFTSDWFAQARDVWPQLKPHLPDNKRFLEIGSYEGRSTVWTIEHLMADGGKIYCIDTWEGGEEHDTMQGVEDTFDHNTFVVSQQFPDRYMIKKKRNSATALSTLLSQSMAEAFDFIYIDGSHIARDVLTDACLSWPLLKKGGVMVFDDYLWGAPRDALHRPKLAIDAFTNIFSEEAQILHTGYQVAIKKAGID